MKAMLKKVSAVKDRRKAVIGKSLLLAPRRRVAFRVMSRVLSSGRKILEVETDLRGKINTVMMNHVRFAERRTSIQGLKTGMKVMA